MNKRFKQSRLGVVLGSLFIVAGLAAGYGIAAKMLIGYVQTSQWDEVPATLHEVNLITNRGDSTTYSVEGSYSYKYEGLPYQGDRISLSSGSDNFGTYWKDLERTLRTDKDSNEASVFVNPSNPTESVLDRTLRWRSVVFGALFFFSFGGAGAYVIWLSSRQSKKAKRRASPEPGVGIDSSEKGARWFALFMGVVFTLVGVPLSVFALPDAWRDGEYGVTFLLIFVFTGLGFIFYAYKSHQAYRRFGPTPLFLDPFAPGVGGELGGLFSINAGNKTDLFDTRTPLQATLQRTRITRSKSRNNSSTNRSIEWQNIVPVYLKQSADGAIGQFLFEIPSDGVPTKELNVRESIEWTVIVEGEFKSANLGQFERSWVVVVGDRAAHATGRVNIPTGFLEKERQASEERVLAAAIEQMPITEDSQNIYINSRALRNSSAAIIGTIVGLLFAGFGLFTIKQNWGPGYFFFFFGAAITLLSLYFMGKSVSVKINKTSLALLAQQKWFGYVYAKHQGIVANSNQFSIRHTLTTKTKSVEYYSVNFKADEKTVRIADAIAGKQNALALIEAVSDGC